MGVRQVSITMIETALRAASPLIARGYEPIDQRVYEEHFGSGWVLLKRDEVRLRILNDRGQWFVEIGSEAAQEEWFDARLVLAEIGAAPCMGTDEAALEQLCRLLVDTAPRWEVLFLTATFATARKLLRARETDTARQQFGVDN